MLQDVGVWMVTRNGEFRDLGKTDVFGGVTLNKQEILAGVVLGFSQEGFFDGVWRVSSEKLRRFDELHIGLAPFSVF